MRSWGQGESTITMCCYGSSSPPLGQWNTPYHYCIVTNSPSLPTVGQGDTACHHGETEETEGGDPNSGAEVSHHAWIQVYITAGCSITLESHEVCILLQGHRQSSINPEGEQWVTKPCHRHHSPTTAGGEGTRRQGKGRIYGHQLWCYSCICEYTISIRIPYTCHM